MNAIIGMNELAIRDYGRPETMEYLRDIRQAGATLLSIINDILDFSKIESGHIQITAARYDTASLLNDALAIIRIRLGDKPIELLADIDPSIPAFMTGDEIRVRQILLNILSNAVKYTNEGFIKFTARCDIIGDEAVDLIFSVEDSGIGIRREDIGRLFGDFSRVDLGRNKNIQGSGLGLSITRLICRAMGGDVTVTSEYGQGSVFTATIRQKCADYVPMGGIEGKISYRAEVGAIRFTAPDFRVLIADDNAANLKVAAGLLAPYKMKVDTCLSGEESVALVKENNYDLVFMDHMMPGMDGIEATKAIRALGGRFDELQIVALTANAISGMKEMFLENGFNDFLSKPIEIPKLDELIERRVPLERRHKAKAITKGVADAEFIGIEGLDTAKGMAMTGGNCANYRSVLELYCRDAESRMGFLELAHAERDLKNFTTQVHALKSASASIGATAVSQEAASLEDAGRRGDMDAIREHAEEFRENLAALIARILSVIRPEVSGDVQTIGEEVITRLASALSAEDVGAADKIMAELSLAPLDSASSRVISEISDLLLISEFEEALGRLKEFK
ncbi:MAG: response regulator [Synergistaceae bacterium]|jgi:CheY-like chemotaxis protein|nr:response regulator [Synergistaceae bacterium]